MPTAGNNDEKEMAYHLERMMFLNAKCSMNTTCMYCILDDDGIHMYIHIRIYNVHTPTCLHLSTPVYI